MVSLNCLYAPLSRPHYRNYPSEISALKHRINSPDYDTKHLVQALTNPTFYERADILGEVTEPHPSREDTLEAKTNNSEFVDAGPSLPHLQCI